MTLFEAAPSIQAILRGAVAAYTERFGAAPAAAAAAPGRVNLIGEHTDYSGGFVLPMAIDRACVAVGGPSGEAGTSTLLAADLDETAVIRHDGLLRPSSAGPDATPSPLARGGWGSYIAGVMAGFERVTGRVTPGFNIAVTASVPFGGGLSSSAALEVSVATLLEQLYGVALDPVEKALLCQRAEHEFAGVPCGIMDQFIATMGREGHALLIDCRSLETTPVPMPPASGPGSAVVLIANSNVHHALADGEYARRRDAVESAARALSVESLRDATPSMVESSDRLNEEERRCARHVVTENERTIKAAEALKVGDLRAMGALMDASHNSLRDDLRVSCPELDTLVDLARASKGVYGARMTGGGFGGSIVALVGTAAGNAHLELAAKHLVNGYAKAHGRDCTLYVTTAQAGAGALDV